MAGKLKGSTGFKQFTDQGDDAPSGNGASFPPGRPDLAMVTLDGKQFFIANEIGDQDFRHELMEAMKQPNFQFDGVSGEEEALALISKLPNFDYGEPAPATVAPVSPLTEPAPQEAEKPARDTTAQTDGSFHSTVAALGEAIGGDWVVRPLPGSERLDLAMVQNKSTGEYIFLENFIEQLPPEKQQQASAILDQWESQHGNPRHTQTAVAPAAPAIEAAPPASATVPANGDMTQKEALDALGNAVREGTGERWIASVESGSGEVALVHYKGTKRNNVILGADNVYAFLQDNLHGEGLATALDALAGAALSGQQAAREQAVTAASNDKWVEANSPADLKATLNDAQSAGKSVSVHSVKDGVLYELEMGGSEPKLRVQDIQTGLSLPLGEVETKAGDLAASKKTQGIVKDFVAQSRGHSEAEPETPPHPLAMNDAAKLQMDDVVRSLKTAMNDVPGMRSNQDAMAMPKQSKGGIEIA